MSRSNQDLTLKEQDVAAKLKACHWDVDYKSELPTLKLTVPHIIMSSNVTCFTDKPIVCIDSSGRCELITLDPASKFLDDFYQALKKDILEQKEDKTVPANLNRVIQFVRLAFSRDQYLTDEAENKLIAEVNAIHQGAQYQSAAYVGLPLIPIDEFIKLKKGVCRHHALLTAYLVDRLKNDKLLPPGTVRHHNVDLPTNEGHSFAIYQQSDFKKMFIVDSCTANQAFEIADVGLLVELGYGESVKEQIMKIYRLAKPSVQNDSVDDSDADNEIAEIFSQIQKGYFKFGLLKATASAKPAVAAADVAVKVNIKQACG